MLNVYGVTEAAISSTVHEITRDGLVEGAEIPLGSELPGERIHVLDESLRPLPTGAVGELAIAGRRVGRGLRRQPEATAARFVTVDALGGERVYLTGDLGYRGQDGLLRFLGRRDNQIKLRGYRIELEEVEAAASAALGGRSCAVVLDREADGGPRLVAFRERADEVEEWDEQALHTELSDRLPGALVPGRWVLLDTMPTLRRRQAEPGGAGPHGRRAGPGRARRGSDPAGRTPRCPTTRPSCCSPRAGARSSATTASRRASHFFHIGGHSLLAAQLAAWLEPRLGERPPLRLLFQHPVLADQARALAEITIPTPATARPRRRSRDDRAVDGPSGTDHADAP